MHPGVFEDFNRRSVLVADMPTMRAKALAKVTIDKSLFNTTDQVPFRSS